MCVFMASGGIGFSSSVSVYNGFGLRNKLRDGPLHNEKARGIFFSPCVNYRTAALGSPSRFCCDDASGRFPKSWWFETACGVLQETQRQKETLGQATQVLTNRLQLQPKAWLVPGLSDSSLPPAGRARLDGEKKGTQKDIETSEGADDLGVL